MSYALALAGDDADPPLPAFAAATTAWREAHLGWFDYEPIGGDDVRVTDEWAALNLTTVVVPELVGVEGAPAGGRVQVHRLVAPKLVELFAAWRAAGLMPLVKSWHGLYASRFIRGRPGVLSAHAWGSAFDINASWNGLGVTPAQRGEVGSVRELVPIANRLGWYWGGHFRSRPDGMHFELAVLEESVPKRPRTQKASSGLVVAALAAVVAFGALSWSRRKDK